MPTQELRVMVGIPASGKSTFIKKEVLALEKEHKTTAVVSRDAVRFSMLKEGEDYFTHEDDVFKEFIRQINECIELGIDVVFVDATHISPNSRFKLLSKLAPSSNTHLVFVVMNTPIDECLNRNLQREGLARVPDNAIRNMAKGFRIPTASEFPNSFGFKDIAIHIYTQKG